eukprot:scaffold2452_cov303-Prasinococcus_capsulatus_cf.AAC.4
MCRRSDVTIRCAGNTLGRHHTTWFCITYTIDSCIYPAMAGKYIANIVRATSASALTAQLNRADADAALGDVSELWDHAWALVIVCVVTAVQLAGSGAHMTWRLPSVDRSWRILTYACAEGQMCWSAFRHYLPCSRWHLQ